MTKVRDAWGMEQAQETGERMLRASQTSGGGGGGPVKLMIRSQTSILKG